MAIRLARLQFGAGLILLLSGFLAPASTNSTWFTRTWTTDDGLINNNIQAIAQGPDGYLWVASSVGLMQFDGIQFSPFPIESFTGSVDNHISTMLSDRAGVLWIATTGGKVIGLKPDLSKVTFPKISRSIGVPLNLAEDAAGSLWLGYANAICRITAGQVTRFAAKEGVPSGEFHSLINDGAGNIWLAKGNQICLFKDGKFQHVLSMSARCLAATPANAVWFVTDDHLWTCDTDRVARDHGAFPDLAHATRRALLEDHNGAVWIGTDGHGLIHYDQSGFQKIGTFYSFIYTLAEDSEGNLWVGTDGEGLNRISLSDVYLESVPASERIESICEDNNGSLWGSTYDGMLASRIDGKWTPVFTNAPFAGTVATIAANRHGGIWFGTRDGKLLQLDNTNYSTVQTNVCDSIRALLPTSKGDLWILGINSLHCLQGGQLVNPTLPREVDRFSAIAEDSKGNIWVGARGVVMCFNGKNFVDETPYLPISNRAICCLYPDPGGGVWISCGGVGLLRFKNEKVSQIGVEQGLPNNYIAQTVADNRGWVWFCSDHGIFKIRRKGLEQAFADHGVHLHPIIYGRNEGLTLEALFSSSSVSLPLALHSRDGQVWLLTRTGVVVANPKVFSENCPSLPVLLTRVEGDGRTIAAHGNVTSTQTVANLITSNVPLQLPPSHRHLEFDFTAFHFGAPENIQFRYELAGFDNDWIEAGTQRSANYSRLTAGHYLFRVAACVGDGQWNESPTALALTVTPFFWQTWWFCLGTLLLFTSSVIAIVRYVSFRSFQAKMYLLKQRAALDKERTRIARDLHDDLGGSLSLAALTLEMTQREPKDWELMNEKIQHCTTLVRRAALSVDEIVWAINPHNDTLRYLVDYFSQFAVELLHSADILCLVELPDDIPNQQISPEVRNNLWLVVKETLNNVTRHAHASEVCLRVTVSENQLAISIKDDGCGFEPPPENASCDGLRNMRQRMEEIGGQFRTDSRPGAGTHIRLLYSLPSQI